MSKRIEITENQIKAYLNSYISKNAIDIATIELYWLLNEQQSIKTSKENILAFCKRNGAD